MKRTGLTLLFTLSGYFIFGQHCECSEQFKWLKKTFEENDAGYVFTLEKKGKQSYELLNYLIAEKAEKCNDVNTCATVLSEWLHYFRENHIGIYATETVSPSEQSTESARVLPTVTEKQLHQWEAAMSKQPISSVEGIWTIGGYTILMKEVKDQIVGYILKSENPDWKPGEVKIQLAAKMDSGVYYLGDHSRQAINQIRFEVNKYLTLNDFTLEKQVPQVILEPTKELSYKAKFADSPFAYQIDDATVYIKLPSFELQHKEKLEALVAEWEKRILQSPYLVIDIRDNGGGSDRTYASILPFIYTNPIYRNLVEFYSSDINNKTWTDLLNNPDLSEEERPIFEDFVKRIEANKGGFEKIFEGTTSVIQLENVHPNPQKVALLINENTASAGEQFIFDLEQSWKVKTFGHQTKGAFDVGNVSTIASPDTQFVLVYSTSRYVTIGKITVDDVGIVPDFYIGDEISEDLWITHVISKLKE